MEKAIKEFIKNFNNYCRNNKNIESWCIYQRYQSVMIEVNFKGTNKSTKDYHLAFDNSYIESMEDAEDYARTVFCEFIEDYTNESNNGE